MEIDKLFGSFYADVLMLITLCLNPNANFSKIPPEQIRQEGGAFYGLCKAVKDDFPKALDFAKIAFDREKVGKEDFHNLYIKGFKDRTPNMYQIFINLGKDIRKEITKSRETIQQLEAQNNSLENEKTVIAANCVTQDSTMYSDPEYERLMKRRQEYLQAPDRIDPKTGKLKSFLYWETEQRVKEAEQKK